MKNSRLSLNNHKWNIQEATKKIEQPMPINKKSIILTQVRCTHLVIQSMPYTINPFIFLRKRIRHLKLADATRASLDSYVLEYTVDKHPTRSHLIFKLLLPSCSVSSPILEYVGTVLTMIMFYSKNNPQVSNDFSYKLFMVLTKL